MLEQLAQLAQQFGVESVVKTTPFQTNKNEAVIEEAGSSIFSGLQKIAAEGGVEQFLCFKEIMLKTLQIL
jgi:hypothetical protein